MAYLGQCAPERIPMELVEGAIENDDERSAALLALTEISLLKHDPFGDGAAAVSVHRLVQAVSRTRSEVTGTAVAALEQVTRQLAAIFPSDAFSNQASWPLCARLVPHLFARSEAEADGGVGTERASLLDRAGSYFHGRAAYSHAESVSEPHLRSARGSLVPSIPIPE
jgi:hypothetical protein